MRLVSSQKTSSGLVAFFLFCLSLALTSYTAKHQDGMSLGRKLVAESIRPFAVVSYGAYDWFSGLINRYVNLIDVADNNVKLTSRLNALESVNSRLVEIEKENIRLQSLLQARQAVISATISARVIGYDPSGWVQSVTINRGSVDGVVVGGAVIDGAGVVGKVISVSPNSARVLLIIDRSSSVDGIIQETRARGVIDGTGVSLCEFRFVNEYDEVRIGDKVITSGMDGIFPKGLVLGVVTGVGKNPGGLFKSIKVTPSVGFSKLEDVLVLIGPIEQPITQKKNIH
jgi:rod shape-determining protein MreC